MKNPRAITMYGTIIVDCQYDHSNNILIGNVYCPNKRCSEKHCIQKETFQSLGRSDYKCPQCKSMCQVRKIPFEQQTNSFSWKVTKGSTFLKRRENHFKMLLKICFVQHLETKSVFNYQSADILVSTTVKIANLALTLAQCFFWNKSWKVIRQSHSSTTQLAPKIAKTIPFLSRAWQLLFGWYISPKLFFHFLFLLFNLQ